MVTMSLAAQLSKGVSLNAPLLADRSRRKHAESYLFASREADQHDYHSIHALGVNGLSKLKTLDAKFAKYDGNIFSDASRDLDRTLQSDSQNAQLDHILDSFLRDLGPYLLESPASKAIEWIIRRFRVNEFNVDSIMAVFLPYHETAQFAKMASILHVKESNLWSFMAPLKAAAKPLPRSMLVDEMKVNRDLARFVITLFPEALGTGRTHRTLTCFAASVAIDYILRMKTVDEEIVAFVLPSLTRTFAPDSTQDGAVAGYVSLAALSQRCRLSESALMAVLSEMFKGQQHMELQQILPFFVAVVSPQEQVDEFPDSITDSIVNPPGFTASLNDCLLYVGIEKLVLPLLPSLAKRLNEAAASDVLNSLMLSPSVPNTVVGRTTHLLLDVALRSQDGPDPAALQLLAVIFQRHGSIFSEISSERLVAIGNGADRQKFEELIRSITLPSSISEDHEKWILSSNAADVGSRVMAVQEMIKTLDIDVIDSESHPEAFDALRSRVADTNVNVVEALYSNPKVVLPIFSNLTFIDAVSGALAAPDISRSVMRLHFTFIAGKLYRANADLAPDMFERTFLPYLLFTKPHQKTATLAWQSLGGSTFAQYELLRGCIDIMQAHPVADGASRSVEEMAALNLAVTNCIAGNIVASNAYTRHLNMLLRLLSHSDAHTTNICYLILRSLLSQLSGEHQVEAAQRILSSMSIQSLDVLQDVMGNATSLQEVLSDNILLKGVILKPSSAGTTRRLQLALVALFPVVQQPVDIKIDWLGEHPEGSSDMRGKHFLELAHATYALANSCSATHLLSTSLLKALFINLREQALLFLAGVWTSIILSDVEAVNLPHAALFHGAAFLRAQVADTDHLHDFQVVLPSLLIALRSKQQIVRSAAMDCVAIVSQSSSLATASPTVYALDSVYGNNSSDLQYLEWLDFGHFVTSLNSRREHFINDCDYLGVFCQEILCKRRSDNKKESGYKQRVLCYLLSHAIAWNSVRARMGLLEILRNIPHSVKLHMLLPLVQSFVSGDQTFIWVKDDNGLNAAYLQLLLETYDGTVITELIEPGSGSWVTFVRLVRLILTNGNVPASVHKTILHQLCHDLFEGLTPDLKREMCICLIESAIVYPDHGIAIKDAMGTLLKDATLIASLLQHFQPIGKDSSQRAPKRPKLDSEAEEPTLRPITILVEMLVARAMPGSVQLMSTTFDILARVFHTQSSQSDVNYLMQLLMSILESIASSISDHNTLAPGSVRMEILVELLRVSDNPQTFNQTLLLIANLARLAPDFVMQNVMPVFTFMGSNVFHRDDSYSFRVVQKTIDSIVPVVVASLKAKHADSIGLQIASRGFLRVFTDAATHIPRHRRTQVFNHLVEVLGRDEFAVSVCLLLVDKVANKVVRRKPGEVANLLGLPLTVLHASSKAVPFKFIEQLLREATRLLDRLRTPDSISQDAFLESPQDADQSAYSTLTNRRIEAIVLFVDFALQQSSRKSHASHEALIQESVQLLLGLTNLAQEPPMSTEFADVSRAAMKALGHLLGVISASEFATTISTILTSDNANIERGAMNLFASRLTNVAPRTRQDISPTIIGIIEYICNKLKASPEVSNFPAVLYALRAVAENADSRELPILTKALPLVVTVARNQQNHTAVVLECILPMSAKLGPRVLPYFHDLVGFCISVLRDVQAGPDDDGFRIEHDAQAVLVALLSSISQFWSIDELVNLGELSLGSRPVCLTLRKAVAKRIPAKQILPAMFRLWPEMVAIRTSSWSSREGFFDLFRRVVRNAPRDDIHQHLRDIFKLFLDAFDMCSLLHRENMERFETLTVTTFVDVVTKLNDAAFKPIYRRLFDWAFNDVTEKLVDRQITFSRVLKALIKLLKGLVTPYMSVPLVPLTNLLDSYSSDRTQSTTLWMSAIDLFQASLIEDEGVFWRTDKLRKLMPTFVAQVQVCPSLGMGETRQALKNCLGAMMAVVEDDALVKKLNLELFMQTRSEDSQIRMFALQCADHLWDGHGDKLAGCVSDVVTFIAECAEDEHDEVAKGARGLKRTIEKRCGSLNVLMQ